jgi:hypothetical protein
MNTSSSNNGITKTVSKGQVTLERVYQGQYQKEGSQTAELKQTVTTKSSYPSKSVTNSLTDNLFDAVKDFGYGTKDYANTSTRVAWIDVPSNLDLEQVRAKLSSTKTSLKQIMSNHPILSDSQEYAIANGITTKGEIANRQVLRFPEGSENAGGLILDRESGKPIYRVNTFRVGEHEDEDLRDLDPENFYVSDEIKNEMLQDQGEDVTQGFFKSN